MIKKSQVLSLVLVLCCFPVSALFAEEMGAEKMKGGMMGKGMMQHNKPSVVATSDGGVVVLDGPRLIKYDAQLNLVGEAELKPGKKPAHEHKAEASEVDAVETAVPTEQVS